MNRFKKELRKKGIKLECDYPWLPYEGKYVTLDSILVNSEMCMVTHIYTSIIVTVNFDRSMNPITVN